MISKIFVIILITLTSFICQAKADIIYLLNGNSVEGIITKENEQSVELDVGFGTAIFSRQEIKSIYKSNQEETALIQKQWKRQRKVTKREQQKRELDLQRIRRKRKLEAKKRLKLKEIEFSQAQEHIIVEALLNKKVKARLLLDTGASTILLSRQIAEELGTETSRAKKEMGKAKMADGREVEVNYIILESVSVQGVEVENILAAVLSEDTTSSSKSPSDTNSDDTMSGNAALPYDGCLGMSFLNKFNFQIDSENKKLILEKLR
ncbi:MAG: retropepsin-like aspartic protease [Candidatus Omnitrophota bacterium]|jgi:predicted aspartyl protease